MMVTAVTIVVIDVIRARAGCSQVQENARRPSPALRWAVLFFGFAYTRDSKDHMNIWILQTLVSELPQVLGLRNRT